MRSRTSEKIFGLFVDLDLAVTQDAEDTVVEEPERSREQSIDEQ